MIFNWAYSDGSENLAMIEAYYGCGDGIYIVTSLTDFHGEISAILDAFLAIELWIIRDLILVYFFLLCHIQALYYFIMKGNRNQNDFIKIGRKNFLLYSYFLWCYLQYKRQTGHLMINFAYIILAYILILEIFVFLLLTILPHRLKSKFVPTLLGSKLMKTLLWIHLGLCIIAGIFYAQLYQTERLYNNQKQSLRIKGTGHTGTEVRISFLSYQIQRVQRNKYITFMVIYATIVLNLYLRILHHTYQQIGVAKKEEKTEGDRTSTATVTVTVASSGRDSTDRGSLNANRASQDRGSLNVMTQGRV